LKPRLALSVKNTLSGDPEAPNLKVVLDFEGMDSFSPIGVVRQVKPLNELLELRSNLADLRGSLQGNDKLESMLRDALTDPDKLEILRAQLAAAKEARAAEAKKG
jgi:type VI secretion system protein ImpB